MASKLELDLWLRSVPLLKVPGEIRMGDIGGMRSTWLNGNQDPWFTMKDTISMDWKGFD